ncbi:MAG: hypothetical protein Kow0047_14870 [Anaerolineae bacterium]
MEINPWSVAAASLATAMARVESQAESQSKVSESSSLEIDNQMFLQLLLTQLRHQDPISPMDGEEFLSQLAQLTTLEQMWKMNESLQSFMSQQQLLQASGMIGRSIEAIDDDGRHITGMVQSARVLDGVVHLQLDSLEEVLLEQVISIR